MEEANEKFSKELEEFEKKKMDKVEQFIMKYRETMEATEKAAKDTIFDGRLKRFGLLKVLKSN